MIKQKQNNGITKLLSKREKEIYGLIIDGFENKAIAQKLFISVKTVEFHKENLKQKLGVKSVRELYNLNLNAKELKQ